MESNRAEESAGHLHRLYFTGSNSFGEPWRLPHPPPEQILDLVYEDAYNRFVEAVNERAGYQWCGTGFLTSQLSGLFLLQPFIGVSPRPSLSFRIS